MASLEELEQALIKADAAGNTDDARVFAGEIRRLRAQQGTQQQQAVPNQAKVSPEQDQPAIPIEQERAQPEEGDGPAWQKALRNLPPAVAGDMIAGITGGLLGQIKGGLEGIYAASTEGAEAGAEAVERGAEQLS